VSKISIGPVPPTGAKHLIRGRNGAVTHGPQMAHVAGLLNTIALRRGKVLLSKYTYLGNFPTPPTTFFGRFYCSPYVTGVQVTMLIGDAGTPAASNYTWTVDGVSQRPHTVTSTITPSPGPSAYTTHTLKFVDGSGDPLAPGVHDVSCTIAGVAAAVTGFVIYETCSNNGETGVNALDPTQFSVGSPVTGANLSGMTDYAWLLHRQQSTHQIHWTDNGLGSTQTGTTYKNILDGTTTGYASTAAGFWAYPFRQSTFNGTTVPVTMWCYASSTGTTGRVRFSNSAGVIGTITGIGAANFYSTTGSLLAANGDDLIVVEHSEAAGGSTITTQGAGMYNLTT
jgi:hypothetical protein